MRKHSCWLICHLITLTGFFSVISIASQSELFDDLAKYNSDKIFFIVFLLAGYLLTQKILKSSSKLDALCICLSYLYFYTAFCFFSDGHAAGWSHSVDIIDKIFVGLFLSFFMLVSIYVPAIGLMIAIFHNTLLKSVWGWARD